MKLKVYQQGGGLIYTPFIPGRTQSTFSWSSSNDGDDSKIDSLDKEILGLMKDQNLLPSDIQAISTALINFQKQTQHLGNPITGGSNNYRSVMPGMLQIMNMVSVARHNREFWNDKLTEIQKHDAGSEVAMDSYGRMWVQDLSDGKLTKIEASKFDKEKYNPVSNSQLMYLRQREYGFGDNILGEGGMDVIGAKDLREEIDVIINEFGKVTAEQYIPGNMQELASDIKEKGIFKVGQERSKGELNDFSGLLYSQLGSSAQHLLNARAALAGYSPIEYLQNIIFSNIDKKDTISYDASLSKATNGGSGSGESGSLVQTTYAEHLVWGDLDPGRRVLIQPGNSDIAMYAYAQNAGPVKKDETVFDSANLNEVFTNADVIGTIVDRSNIFFGDYRLNSNEFSKVMYDNGENMERVELPVKPDENNPSKFVIDFDAQRKANKVQEYIRRNGGMIPDELIEEQLEDIPGAYWDRERKVIRFKDSRPFLVIKGIASSEKVGFDEESPYISYMPKDENDNRRDYMDMYNNAINYGYAGVPSDKKKPSYDNGKTAGRHLYRGNVYMPLSGEVVATALYNKERLPVSSYMAGTPTNMAQLNQDKKKVKSNFSSNE